MRWNGVSIPTSTDDVTRWRFFPPGRNVWDCSQCAPTTVAVREGSYGDVRTSDGFETGASEDPGTPELGCAVTGTALLEPAHFAIPHRTSPSERLLSNVLAGTATVALISCTLEADPRRFDSVRAAAGELGPTEASDPSREYYYGDETTGAACDRACVDGIEPIRACSWRSE